MHFNENKKEINWQGNIFYEAGKVKKNIFMIQFFSIISYTIYRYNNLKDFSNNPHIFRDYDLLMKII